MNNPQAKKIICFAHLNGDFAKFSEIFEKILSKSGRFDLVILLGKVFNIHKDFSQVTRLDKFDTKFVILDASEVGVVCKHKHIHSEYNLSEKVKVLSRSGFYIFDDIRIAYLNGKENTKFLSEDEKFKYTSFYFSRDDVGYLLEQTNGSRTDIFISNCIPSIIQEELFSNKNFNKSVISPEIKDKVSKSLNLVMKKIRPRYILTSVDDFFFERTPFLNQDKLMTRYINIAFFPSELKKNLKEKFLYAISIKPIKTLNKEEMLELGNSTTEHTSDIFKYVSDDLTSLFLNTNTVDSMSAMDAMDAMDAKDAKGGITNPQKDTKYKVNKEELYIGNLDNRITHEEVSNFLSQFGELEFLNFVYDRRNNFTGHGFAKYKDLRKHEMLIPKSNEFSLRGRKVVIGEKMEKQIKIEDIEKRCWFCFSNPNIDSDLIIREFKLFYLAYPKGPIDDFHLMLIPKKHFKSFLDLDTPHKSEFVEIIKTVLALFKDNSLDYAIWEKNLPYKDEAAKHLIINILGINKDLSFSFLDHAYNTLNQSNLKYKEYESNLTLEEIAKNIGGNSENKSNSHLGNCPYYYYIDAPTGIQFGRSGLRTKILVEVDKCTKDYQDYPRKILCNLIDREDRFNWKNCETNKEFLVKLKDKIFKYFN